MVHTVKHHHSGFTLIELAVVIMIIGIALGLVAIRTGTFAYLKEEAFIRQFSETLVFLHHQAMADEAFYRMEIDLDDDSYHIGVMRTEEDETENLKDLAASAGSLTLELAAFLSPSLGKTQTMIPPPNLPSLSEPVHIPTGSHFIDVRTRAGLFARKQGGKVGLMFSPRGFSDFAVIHLKLSNGKPVTILVNPFTGLTEIFRDDRDFQWTYDKTKGKT